MRKMAMGSVGILFGVSVGLTWSAVAAAQPAAKPPSPAPAAPTTAPQTTGNQNASMEVPTELLQVTPSGLTGEQVAARAAATSYSAKANEELLRSAAAKVDQAWASFLPRLTLTGKYTRLSDFTPPSIGQGSLVGTPTTVPAGAPVAAGDLRSFGALAFPLVLDNWLLQASINVPISDYFLKINQAYTASTQAQEAARYDVVAARAKSASDGKVTFYTWLRNRGAVIVAVQSLNDQKNHLKDAQNQFAVGNASKADVLRAETSVASAELAVERAKNLAELTEQQVRVAMHAPDSESIAPGEALDTGLPPLQGNLKQLTLEAFSGRYEIKSIDANAEVARQQASATRGGMYPSVSAFANGYYANPNSRRFPQQNEWFPTWDAGAQIVWSPNDILISNAGGRDAEARAKQLEAQKQTTRDGIEIEVLQAYQGVREADFALESTKRQLASAEEAYRVARELFNNGRGTSTTLTDAETELTRARLEALNAKADARIARTRLDHALGRDARQFAGNNP